MTNNDIKFFLKKLQQEEIIAYPTEGVFGLGCDPDSKRAVLKLQNLKKRSLSKGFILVAANYKQLNPYIANNKLSYELKKKVCLHNATPITWLVPAKINTPSWLTGSFNSLAIRISHHPSIVELCNIFQKPLVSTSANISGTPACRSLQEIRYQFGYELPVYPGNIGSLKHCTEIRDLLSGQIIRSGG
ncbi:MAG: Sua5/YciO/YrdC/YwlC family protein [Candidatus Dasytiphilus stammeri]